MTRDSTSVFSLAEQLENMMLAKRIDDALVQIRHCVEDIINEPLCAARVMDSELLDGFCQKIGCLTLQNRHPPTPREGWQVYLVSKLQKSGGHTRVLEDIIRAAPKHYRHLVLSTELTGASDREAVQERLKELPVSFEWAGDFSHQDKLLWLQKRLHEAAPENVWIFSSHQDSTIIAAAQPAQGYKTYFYHHADHHLALGVHLPHAVHIDPHPMGYSHCRHHLGFAQNVYLPLWVQDEGYTERIFLREGALVTCTAARANKVEVPYAVNYANMVPAILAATGGRHVHIGQLTPWALMKIRFGLRRRGIREDRFLYVPYVTCLWKALQDYRVDFYIASFPYGGARTLIEAMGAGVPVAVHDHCSTRLLGGMDIAYPEAFAWRNPADLYTFLRRVDAGFLREQSHKARAFFLAHHDAGLFRDFSPDKLGSFSVPELARPHKPDLFQWGLDVVKQTGLRGVLWRFFYRHRRFIGKLFFA